MVLDNILAASLEISSLRIRGVNKHPTLKLYSLIPLFKTI